MKKMNLRTTEPKWIPITEAAKLVDPTWDSQNIIDFMILNSFATPEQLSYGIYIPNVLRRRPDHSITDYNYDLHETTDHLVDKLVHLYNQDLLSPEGKTYWICAESVAKQVQPDWKQHNLIKFLFERKHICFSQSPMGYRSLHGKIKFIPQSLYTVDPSDRMIVQIDIIPFLLSEWEKYLEEYWQEQDILAHENQSTENSDDIIL